jgi:oligopeptidase A
MANYPLLKFSNIQIDTIFSRLQAMIADHRAQIDALTNQEQPTWQSVIDPLSQMDKEFSDLWSPFSHLNNVTNTEQIRQVYNQCLPIITEHSNEIGQNAELFSLIQQLHQQQKDNLNAAQQKVCENLLRNFTLAGVDLNDADKATYQNLSQALVQLCTKFEENVMDATQAWSKHITDAQELSGLPDHALALAKQTAAQKELEGYVFTLHIPSYLAVMKYADNRELRQQMHSAYATRASDQGPNADEYDNSQIMLDILQNRHDLARLLDFDTYADYSLATKMVKQPQRVLDFLWQLVQDSREQGFEELDQLKLFAKEQLQLDTLEPWDLAYVSEKLKQQHYAISDQELRPYFPTPKVIEGLFEITRKLFNVEIREIEGIDTWHAHVKCYALHRGDEVVSLVYFDLYARDKKRGGAWMDDAQNRYRNPSNELDIPIAFVTCNFNPPLDDSPALLSHDDVVTLFHEFGHALQHMLTRIDYLDVSGLNGIPWDAVEVCSQFLENWAWEAQCMPLISSHYQTGETLPQELLEKMQQARNFQSAMQMLRQLELALFDFNLHLECDQSNSQFIQTVLDNIRQQVSVIDTPDYNRFQHAFSHIFAGGYAAGYYSYKWAEVMAADAFSLFQEKGIFDTDTSRAFEHTFMASGGAREPLDVFIDFRGREPEVAALLQQSGITATTAD